MKIVRNLLSSLLMLLAFGMAMPSAVEAQPSPPSPPDLPAPPPLPAPPLPEPPPLPPGRVVVHTEVRPHYRHHRRHYRHVRRHRRYVRRHHVVRHHVRRHHRHYSNH